MGRENGLCNNCGGKLIRKVYFTIDGGYPVEEEIKCTECGNGGRWMVHKTLAFCTIKYNVKAPAAGDFGMPVCCW